MCLPKHYEALSPTYFDKGWVLVLNCCFVINDQGFVFIIAILYVCCVNKDNRTRFHHQMEHFTWIDSKTKYYQVPMPDGGGEGIISTAAYVDPDRWVPVPVV